MNINKILEEKIEALERQVEEMRPVFEWAMRRGYCNFFPPMMENQPEPVIVGEHVSRFYSMFHWNDIDNDTLSSFSEKVTKAENLLARIYKSVLESDDTITVDWIMEQLGKIFFWASWERLRSSGE